MGEGGVHLEQIASLSQGHTTITHFYIYTKEQFRVAD